MAKKTKPFERLVTSLLLASVYALIFFALAFFLTKRVDTGGYVALMALVLYFPVLYLVSREPTGR